MSFLPFKSKDYVERFFPNQELFSIGDMRRAYSDGCKTGTKNTLANWVSVEHTPRQMANQYVFVMCYSPETGVDIFKLLTTEYADFVEARNDALYWCYEYRIAPKKIRKQFQEIRET